MQRKTVVLVCMVDSIHVARWIAQFDTSKFRFVLFPSGPNRRVHPKIVEMMSLHKSKDVGVSIVPVWGILSIALWMLDRLFQDRIRGYLLRRTIAHLRPDFLHALEFQHSAYVASRAIRKNENEIPFIVTNYGSDIYRFQQFPRHLRRIQEVLALASLYSAECERDVELAKEYGFAGKVLPVMPNAGGLPSDVFTLPKTRPSLRRTIAIKGYEGWAGQASIAIEAVANVANLLDGYRIVVYSAESSAARKAREVSKMSGLHFTVFKKNALSHEELLRIFGESRAYVGISKTDGISTSLLEAMAMGAYPIQTSTSCANEWLKPGSGTLIERLEPELVSSALRFALTEGNSVDAAAKINAETIRERANITRSTEIAQQYYE